MNLTQILTDGHIIDTSGTTGPAKQIWQSPDKIRYANEIACITQGITSKSRILTVCSLDHAGGLLAQTLPAISINAHVDITEFNPYKWVRDITRYTHSHLTPSMAHAIMGTKTFKSGLSLEGITIMCGSDRVPATTIQAFINIGARFIANWGMSEVGPVAINQTFNPGDKVNFTKSIMGDTTWCDTQIVDGELFVMGDICVYNDWFATGDLVEYEDGRFWYNGRK
jgi:acyl-CoA synthetase (AMP-forming)/AMP-acid ligase II|tara:strand:- start:686 stop:1360 length:675 start_codon:yes stop_codon:yes gene_type:complete